VANAAGLAAVKAGTATSFGPVKQIKAGVLWNAPASLEALACRM
jgi:hypothetical protein